MRVWTRHPVWLGAGFMLLAWQAQVVAATASVQGVNPPGHPMDIRYAKSNQWDKLDTTQGNRKVNAGDLLHTPLKTTAFIQIDSEEKRIFMKPDAFLQVPEEKEAWMAMFGKFHWQRRPASWVSEIITPKAVLAALKTDFYLDIKPNGDLLVIVLSGEMSVTSRSNILNSITLTNGQSARVFGAAIVERVLRIEIGSPAYQLAQSFTYYPGVLNVDELDPSLLSEPALTNSLAAYSNGNLRQALLAYPINRIPTSASERLYLAALKIALSEIQESEDLLGEVEATGIQTNLAAALRELIHATEGRQFRRERSPETSTEWLAESYYQQSRVRHEDSVKFWEISAYGAHTSTLERALIAAQNAARKPGFGFAAVRLAELEFSFGHHARAIEALEKGRGHIEENAQAAALRGFLAWAENRYSSAELAFAEARRLDSSLGNAWLGLGLSQLRKEDLFSRFCKGHPWRHWRADSDSEGLKLLEAAVNAEPQTSVLRSYLAKAYYEASGWWGQDSAMKSNAVEQLAIARHLDPKDPTPPFYSSLMEQQLNQVNSAVRDAELAIERNDNRQLYRSTLLLDQDRAVRNANLASIYNDAGLFEQGLSKASEAIVDSTANSSAHLFLSDAYNQLRDPTRFNLRYETVWLNELLLANALSPVGAGRLSLSVSQGEYTRLFEKNGLQFSCESIFRSDRSFAQVASQSGQLDGTEYSLDVEYRRQDGVRMNNDLDSIDWYTSVKQRVGQNDTVMAILKFENYTSGDNFQYLDPTSQARPNFRFQEKQEPISIAIWHHEWSPGMHTLLLGGRLVNQQHFSDLQASQIILFELADGSLDSSDAVPFDVDYHARFETYTVELNQIADWDRFSISAGARYQSGTFQTTDSLFNPAKLQFLFGDPFMSTEEDHFERVTGYAYANAEPFDHFWLVAGLAYESEEIPSNFRHPPVYNFHQN